MAQEFPGKWAVRLASIASHDDIRMTGQDIRWRAARREHLDSNIGFVRERVQNDVGKQPRKINEGDMGGHASYSEPRTSVDKWSKGSRFSVSGSWSPVYHGP